MRKRTNLDCPFPQLVRETNRVSMWINLLETRAPISEPELQEIKRVAEYGLGLDLPISRDRLVEALEEHASEMRSTYNEQVRSRALRLDLEHEKSSGVTNLGAVMREART